MGNANTGGIVLPPGNQLKPRKDERVLVTALGWLSKARVIKTPSNAPAKNRRAGAHSR